MVSTMMHLFEIPSVTAPSPLKNTKNPHSKLEAAHIPIEYTVVITKISRTWMDY